MHSSLSDGAATASTVHCTEADAFISGFWIKSFVLTIRPTVEKYPRTASSIIASLSSRARAVDAYTSDTAAPTDEPVEPIANAELQKEIAHLHTSMGHPSPSAMARAVRLTGGSLEAIRACLAYRCVFA